MKNKCIGCGACARACPLGHINMIECYPRFNRAECIACKACENICPNNAIKFAGDVVISSEIMETVLRDSDYYKASGGGITFSGGEAFVQFEGLMDLLLQSKKNGLHTVVETCGQVNPEKIRHAFPLVDLFLFDIKHTDKDLLKKETNADLDLILTNLQYIAQQEARKIIIRVPTIPKYNYNETTILEIFDLAKVNDIEHIRNYSGIKREYNA